MSVLFGQPYIEGPGFVQNLYERGGWDAVDGAYDDPPVSTAQTIHPGAYPTEQPLEVTVTDRSTGEWAPLPGAGTRTVGEAGVFTTLRVTGAITAANFTDGGGPLASRSYDHPASAGWAGDTLVAYTDTERDGYVWKLQWDSSADAREFAAAYREGLRRQGARVVSNDTYVLPEGPFADAFRVTREADTVVVTNGPAVADLAEIRPRE